MKNNIDSEEKQPRGLKCEIYEHYIPTTSKQNSDVDGLKGMAWHFIANFETK